MECPKCEGLWIWVGFVVLVLLLVVLYVLLGIVYFSTALGLF